MLETLINWEIFKKAGVIHIFISKPDEPDTRQIIENCWSSGKKVAVPLVLPNTFDLIHSEIKSFDNLIYGSVWNPRTFSRKSHKNDSGYI